MAPPFLSRHPPTHTPHWLGLLSIRPERWHRDIDKAYAKGCRGTAREGAGTPKVLPFLYHPSTPEGHLAPDTLFSGLGYTWE